LAEALYAQDQGADRIELCLHPEKGGITPPVQLVNEVSAQIKIPVRVLIRETSYGFEVNDEILEAMMASIDRFKKFPIEGFVFGILKNNSVDGDAMVKLIANATPLHITFHKAIDQCDSLEEEIKWINQFSSIDTILTSGSEEKASDGTERILQMKKLFNGKIMAGGKIMNQELLYLHSILGLEWYHGRNIVGKR
jgi:copper homeostasis protein